MSHEIRKGGKLISTEWVYDEETETGSYQQFDRTDVAVRCSFEYCDIAEDVTLKDIFLLLNRDLDHWEFFLGNWCKEIVTEGLTGKPGSDANDREIDYLEIYNDVTETNCEDETYTSGLVVPDFHGYGDWDDETKGGIGVSFTPSNELINLPVKISKDLPIYSERQKLTTFKNPTYSLGQILYAIIWELSFHGGPDSRDELKDTLDSSCKEAIKELEEKE